MKQSSSVALINKDKFLMHLRDDKPSIPYPNYWSLIGGGIEKGETPLQALERECLEEIGIKPKNIRFIGKTIIPHSHLSEANELFIFRGEIDKEIDEIALSEGQRLEYFYFDDISNLKLPYKLKEFLLRNKNLLF